MPAIITLRASNTLAEWTAELGKFAGANAANYLASDPPPKHSDPAVTVSTARLTVVYTLTSGGNVIAVCSDADHATPTEPEVLS